MAGEIYANLVGKEGNQNALSQYLNLKRAFQDAQRQRQIEMMDTQRKTYLQEKMQGLSRIYGGAASMGMMSPESAATGFSNSINPGMDISGATNLASLNPSPQQDTGTTALSPMQSQAPLGQEVPSNTGTSSGRNENYLNSLPPENQSIIKEMADYKYDLGKMSFRTRTMLAQQVAQYDPNFSMQEYDRRNAFLKKWDSSPIYAQTQQSLDVLSQHLDLLNNDMKKLDNANLMIANAGKNAALRQVGKKELSNVMVDTQAVATELARALRGAGALSIEEEDGWEKKINSSSSPEQIGGIVGNLMKLMVPRFSVQINKYNSVMKRYPEGTFTPEAIDALKKLYPEKIPSTFQNYLDSQGMGTGGAPQASQSGNPIQQSGQGQQSSGKTLSLPSGKTIMLGQQ